MEDKTRIGSIYYNRGVVHGIVTVEAIRKAQEKYGKKPLTGEQIRWGIENLNITEARLKELGAAGFMQPLKVTLRRPRRRRRGQVPAMGRQAVEGDHRLDPARQGARARDDRGVGGGLREGKEHHAARLQQGKLSHVSAPRVTRDSPDWSVGLPTFDPAIGSGRSGFRRASTAPNSLPHIHAAAAATPTPPVPGDQQHRGHLRPRDPGAEGGVAARAGGEDRHAARRERRGQDDDAEGDLEPAARRARRRDQGHDRVHGAARRPAHAESSWCAWACARSWKAGTASST